MNFYIDIIDTLNDDYETSLENAAKDSIVLQYNGSDDKDELFIVGSNLDFTIKLPIAENEDAALVHFFTGDETRWRVEMRKETDDELIWQGFLLPDSYSEPYESGALDISLRATDGLGRLKGKFLPDTYYQVEHKVTDILAEILQLTGLQFDIVIATGIENREQKNWDSIFIDGTTFVDRNKYQDAYSILETLMHDTVSCVYQHFGVWYIEGLNKRNLVSYSAKRYTYEGVFIANETIEKNTKNITNKQLKTPDVTMVPPYNIVTVTHEREALGFKPTLSKEVNDGWKVDTGVEDTIIATDWFGYDEFYAKAKSPNYNVYLESNDNVALDIDKAVRLRKKVYVKKDMKLKLTMAFSLDLFNDPSSGTIDNLINGDHWKNPLRYIVFLNNTQLYTNYPSPASTAEALEFDSDKKAEINVEFIPQESGLLNIVLFQPFGLIDDNRIQGIFIDAFELEEIAATDELLYEDEINGDYTVDKDIELTYADDAMGISKAFRLGRLDVAGTGVFNTYSMLPLYSFSQSGFYYSVVSLQDANVIADNLDALFWNNGSTITAVTNAEVVYNLNSGEQMVVKTTTQYTNGAWTVYDYRTIDYDQDRSFWERWTDSIYEIENKRYGEAVLGVYRRLFANATRKVDCDVIEPIMFHDIVQWNYVSETNYQVTASSINFDDGHSTITMVQAAYQQGESQIPPYVDVVSPIYLYDNQSTANLQSTAYDPDGTIVSYLWEKVSGPSGDTITATAQEDTSVTGLTGNVYQYKITVTDNDALTAEAYVDIIRVVDYTITLTETDSQTINDGDELTRQKVFTLGVSPSLPSELTINLSGVIGLLLEKDNVTSGLYAYARVRVFKNSIAIVDHSMLRDFGDDDNVDVEFNASFNFINTDFVQVAMQATTIDVSPIYFVTDVLSRATFELSSGTLVDYQGSVVGLPIVKTVESHQD